MLKLRKCIIALIIILLFSGQSLATTKEKIKIAYLTDLTGPGAYWGQYSLIGAELAAKEFSSKGIDVELIVADHKLNTKNAVSLTHKTLLIDKADALVIEFAPTAIAASPVALKAKKLFLNASAATSLLKSNPYAFTGYLDYEKGCEHVARYWKERGIKKLGVLKPFAEFAELCLKGAYKVYPNLIVQEHQFNESVKSHVLKFKQKKVEAILNPGLEGDVINMFKALQAINFQVPVAGTRQDAFTNEVVHRFSHMLTAAVSFGFPAVPLSFAKRLSQYDPAIRLDSIEAIAYGYFYVSKMVEALSECSQKDITCQLTNLSNAKGDSLLPFKGWNNRRASYKYLIEEWYGANSYPIERES